MRRGRPGIGGWRGENHRHFRPRSGGAPLFRPPRGYGLLDAPRFPPLGPRLHRPPPFPFRSGNDDSDTSEPNQLKKYKYFPHTQHRPDRGMQQRHMLPYIQRQNNDHGNSQQDINFFEDSMGDVDYRHLGNTPQNRDYGKRHTTWINPALDKRPYYSDRSLQKYYKHHESSEVNKMPSEDYTGHRPPASDHYGSSNSVMNSNNTAFSRSVDDTVDIIRKRLRDRTDGQSLSSQELEAHNSDNQSVTESNKTYSNDQQEPPTKKRIQRTAQVKSNCDKIKNNIVHQLFKMDKNKIHKLMDNPSSSTKFEYAISSLITESQNSLNRHLRSVAEKSLNNSSTDCIHDDNNTIYEDTFMKQMQCILDPQDTVFLEDIKPIVMAELNKILQLNEYVPGYDINDEEQALYQSSDPPDYPYYNEPSNFDGDSYNYENRLYEQELANEPYYNDPKFPKEDKTFIIDQTPVEEPKQLYERRPTKDTDYSEKGDIDERQVRKSIEAEKETEKQMRSRETEKESQRHMRSIEAKKESQRQMRRSMDAANEDKFKNIQETVPLFDVNAEQLSEDEDPFAELDNQYHVAVDHSFIRSDDITSPQQSVERYGSKLPNFHREEVPSKLQMSNVPTLNIKQEIDSQLKSLVKSPIKLVASFNHNDNKNSYEIEFLDHPKENISKTTNHETRTFQGSKTVEIKQEISTKLNDKDQIEKSENSSNVMKASTPSNVRKRSIDQRPSHRKEKRKKSESSPTDTNRHNSHKNNPSSSEKSHCAAKDILNIYYTKDDSSETKKLESNKNISEKFVKRKKEQRKSKDNESNKRHNSNSSSHSIVSPKDNSLSSNTQTLSKADAKKKLKPIDMFMGLPKKSTSHHQPHRNTATANTPAPGTKNTEEKAKIELLKAATKVTVNHVSTQVMRKLQTKETQTSMSKSSTNRFSQTDKKKLLNKFVQTDPVSFDKKAPKAIESFERMKEIDLEIQVLLQEKFKLYNSIESRESCQSNIQTLGMTVLNVTPVEDAKVDEDNEDTLSEDAIVDDFTSIPVEELEQIALETVQDEKRSRRRKTLEVEDRQSCASPVAVAKSGRKVKTPNISLIEQIITSDKPLEDIIVLDELENLPLKPSKKKSQKTTASKKKGTKKKKANKPEPVQDIPYYNIKKCSVVLERVDISRYLVDPTVSDNKDAAPPPDPVLEVTCLQEEPNSTQNDEAKCPHEEEIIEETVDNHIQFDMLDVSEDIVIGDSCEVKSDDRDSSSRMEMTVSEEIILDNSQSSCEEVFTTDGNQGESVCKMFDYSTDENLKRDSVTVTGNADAVLAIECIENNFIVACLDGNVYHFSGDGQLLNTLRGSNLAVTCLTIVKEKYGTTVYTGSLDSRIRYYDLETGLEKGPECNVLSPIQTMDRAWDTVFVGTRTGFVLQFECKNNMLIPVSTVKFSDQSILALRAIKEGPRKVLLVAARSEDVTIKDAQSGLLLRTLAGPKMTVYTLLFEDGKVYCGTSSHQVHVFDYASGGHVGTHEGGKGAVCLRASGGLLFAGCYDGCVYVYREGEPRPLAQLRGPSLMLLSLAIVGTKIIAGYKDRSLYIWKIPLSILQEMIL